MYNIYNRRNIMSKSKITLYKTRLAPSLNYQLDDIDKYLDTCTSYEVGEVRYTQPLLSQVIVIKKPQSTIMGLGYNYAKIVNDGYVWYAFVQSVSWGSKGSVKLNVGLDTIHTIGTYIIDKMTSQTTIIREHINRWKCNDTGVLTAIVDEYDEGINVAKDYLESRNVLVSTCNYHVLISKNLTTPDETDKYPYATLMVPQTRQMYSAAGTGSTTYTFSPTMYNIYYITEGAIKVTDTTSSPSTYTYAIGESKGEATCRLISFYRSSTGSIVIKRHFYTNDTFPYSYKESDMPYSSDYSKLEIANSRRVYVNDLTIFVQNTNPPTLDKIVFYNFKVINAGYYAAQYVDGIDDIDKTNSSISQIVCVPEYREASANYTFIEGYNMLLPSADTFSLAYGTLNTNIVNHTPDLDESYNPIYESKLLHPSITDTQFVYQGNIIRSIDWTKADIDDTLDYSISMTYDPTTIQMLKFTTDLNYYRNNSEFDKYSYVALKYNVPLFTSEWNDYVRNGYNYDVADYNRQKSLQGWNIAIGTIQTAIGLAAPISNFGSVLKGAKNAYKKAQRQYVNDYNQEMREMFNNPNIDVNRKQVYEFNTYDEATDTWETYPAWTYSPQERLAKSKDAGRKAALAKFMQGGKLDTTGQLLFTQTTNGLNSGIAAAYSIATANANYQQSITSKSQAHTVITGNTNSYKLATDNQIEYQVWKPQEYLYKNIAKVFYYTGYSHPVQEKPNTTSRTYFNYIQCSPVWDIEVINNTNPLWLADYTSRLQSGLTVFHKVNNTWDLDQVKENWEVSLIGE